MVKIKEVLMQCGLQDKEIAVYQALLGLGPSPVRTIAAKAGVNRGTTYDILKNLQEQGLTSYYHKEKHQYFVAEDPARLRDAVEARQQQLKGTLKELDEIIPQLRSAHDNAGGKPVVRYYEGLNGIKSILQEVLATCRAGSKQYYAYSAASLRPHLYQAYRTFSDDRVVAGVRVQTIALGAGGETVGLDERKWLTKKDSAPTYTIIYDGHVAFLSVNQHREPWGVVMEDENVYRTQRMLFEFTWSGL